MNTMLVNGFSIFTSFFYVFYSDQEPYFDCFAFRPGVTVGFEFLEQLAAFVGEDGKSYEPVSSSLH